MVNEVVINDTGIAVKEYNGQRVITFKDIDMVHGRPEGTARKRFNDNKKHFINGEDYFVRNSDEAKNEFGITAPNGLMLITESGYLMLVKSFTDELAWKVQRALVKSYFRAKGESSPVHKPSNLTGDYKCKMYGGLPVLTNTDIECYCGVDNSSIYRALKKICIPSIDYQLLKGITIAQFKADNPDFPQNVPCVYVVYRSGFDKLVSHFGLKCKTPLEMSDYKRLPPSEKRRPMPKMDDYLLCLDVLDYVKSCVSSEEGQKEISSTIKYCAMSLGLNCSG